MSNDHQNVLPADSPKIRSTCVYSFMHLQLQIRAVAQMTGEGVRTAPPGKLNVKTWPPLSLYFGIQYYFGFQ